MSPDDDAYGRNDPEDPYTDIISRNPHIGDYFRYLKGMNISRPRFTPHLTGAEVQEEDLNIIYPVGDPIFIHIRKEGKEAKPRYVVMEPELEDLEGYHQILDLILRYAPTEKGYETREEFNEVIRNLLNRVTVIVGSVEEKMARKESGQSSPILPSFLKFRR